MRLDLREIDIVEAAPPMSVPSHLVPCFSGRTISARLLIPWHWDAVAKEGRFVAVESLTSFESKDLEAMDVEDLPGPWWKLWPD